MQVHELKRNKKGFTLIETIVALGLVALIAAFLLPSLAHLLKYSNRIQDESKVVFALEEAIERNKNKKISNFNENINGVDVNIDISSYDDEGNLNLISVKSDEYELNLVVDKP